jgi:tetratricopeptide (TPR) repeat protein
MAKKWIIQFTFSIFLFGFGISVSLAQQKLTAEQEQKLKEAQQKLEELKKSNPMMSGYSIPDANKVNQQVADASKKINDTAHKTATARQHLKNFQLAQQQQLSVGLPKKSSARAGQYQNSSRQAIVALASALLQDLDKKIDTLSRFQLNQVVLDTNCNLEATGVFMLAGGFSKYPSEYLIAKAVLRNPGNQWASNDLGLIFRDEQKNDKALQCFYYAEQLDPKSIVIKANVGWAAFYLGDYETAKTYFNKAIAISDNFTSAWEGLGYIAYQEGDIQTLFKCLTKQLTGMGGGGTGPSPSFSSFCGGVQMDQDMQNNGNLSQDPSKNHTYDQQGNNDDAQQDPPATGDEESPTYPSFKPVFVTDVPSLVQVAPRATQYMKKAYDLEAEGARDLKNRISQLPSLHQTAYVNDYGERIVPYSYEKYYSLFHNVHLLFEDRIKWILGKLDDEMKEFLLKIPRQDQDLFSNYMKAMAPCQDRENRQQCIDQVNCEWIPRLRGSKNSDIEGVARIWNKYFDQLVDNIHWYTQSTSEYIRRVHQPGWNEYMNKSREWDVRAAVLRFYARWCSSLPQLNTAVAIAACQAVPNCFTKMPTMGDGADPYKKKIGKLKTFAGPCYIEPSSADLGFVTFERNCDHIKFGIGAPNAKAIFEKDFSRKFVEDDTYKIGLQIGVSKKFSAEESVKGFGKAGVDAKLGADVTFYSKYNSDFQKMGNGIDVTLSASASTSAELTVEGGSSSKWVNTVTEQANDAANKYTVNPLLNREWGVSIDMQFFAVAGPDGQVGSYNLTGISADKK